MMNSKSAARLDFIAGRKMSQLLQQEEEVFDKDFGAKFGDIKSKQLPEGTHPVCSMEVCHQDSKQYS